MLTVNLHIGTFLVVNYLCLDVKAPKKEYILLLIKYMTLLIIISTVSETSHIRGLEVVMFL